MADCALEVGHSGYVGRHGNPTERGGKDYLAGVEGSSFLAFFVDHYSPVVFVVLFGFDDGRFGPDVQL